MTLALDTTEGYSPFWMDWMSCMIPSTLNRTFASLARGSKWMSLALFCRPRESKELTSFTTGASSDDSRRSFVSSTSETSSITIIPSSSVAASW
jgi:hypothetical protein